MGELSSLAQKKRNHNKPNLGAFSAKISQTLRIEIDEYTKRQDKTLATRDSRINAYNLMTNQIRFDQPLVDHC